jgi:predicted lysophospholipase L1 biosynthesis ABC-type transport system permease subunit
VVADSRNALDADVEDTFYYPLQQYPFASTLVIRTNGTPVGIDKSVRAAIHSIDPDQPVENLRTLEQLRSDSMTSPRLTMLLLSSFAGLALLITATGIGGVIGFFVSQRQNEIGIRIALGAARSAVLWMVLREGMILILFGMALGFAGSFGLGYLMAGLLFQVRAMDSTTFMTVAVVLISVAAGACLVPAYRAATMDPTAALRND